MTVKKLRELLEGVDPDIQVHIDTEFPRTPVMIAQSAGRLRFNFGEVFLVSAKPSRAAALGEPL